MSHPSRSTTEPAMNDEAIIELTEVAKTYKGTRAVDGVDLTVYTGEIFGILGPNGAGKTTTLEMIEGLRSPDAGSITVAGLDAVRDNDAVRKIIGVQLQSTALFPYLSAGELIDLFGHLYDMPQPAERVDELLRLVDLEEKKDARVDQMSGGQQQRLSIALALVNAPKVTFLDEPTTGLDPHARRTMWDTILGVRQSGTTVVLTTHYMEEAEVLCDRIAIMDSGRIIACDTPAALIRGLNLDAAVSASIQGPKSTALTQGDFDGIAGVTSAVIDAEPNLARIRLHSSNVQSTITGLLRLADDRDIQLEELSSTRATLEDVFLNLTGRRYEDSETGETAEPEDSGRKRQRSGM